MKITCVKVSNYRNIDGITVNLNPETSYIIGENNLGKSNFLSLLNTVCNGNSFDDDDFANPDEPIMVEMEIKLHSGEKGFFGENFSPQNSSIVKILFQQNIKDASPTIICPDSSEAIQVRQLRKINFLRYDTTSIPSKELRLNNERGAGLLVNSIIKRFISDGKKSANFLNNRQIEKLTEYINKHLRKIRSFRDYGIKATVASDPVDMLTDLLYLSDSGRRIETTGSGVQYMAMASTNILSQILNLYRSKSIPFESRLYTKNKKKLLPLVLSIDEPEVHLHPFLQRSLIRYYNQILQNKDAEFVKLLKFCFGIDGIDGQLIIVTHSTDALIGDYRNLIRFYKEGDKISVVSVTDKPMKISNEKHLIMHFRDIKEAFYAHCAILVEGETEYGCIHAFAEKIGVSLDDYCISIINAKGEKTIPELKRLLQIFKIPCICIYDRDVKKGEKPADDEFFTQELCFEIEIVSTLYDKGRKDLVKKIAFALDKRIKTVPMDFDLVRKPFKKMGIDLYSEIECKNCGHKAKVMNVSSYTPRSLSDVDDSNRYEFVKMYAAWFIVKKGVLLGRLIGDILPADLIPDCFVKAIRKAQEVASNA